MAPVNRMRAILLRHPEVVTVVSQHGRPDNGSDAAGLNNVELFVPLKPFEEWAAGRTKSQLVAELQEELSKDLVGIELNFSQYIQDNVEEGLSGVKGANSIKIIGADLKMLERLADQVYKEVANVRGIEDLGIFRVLGQPNLNIRIDRDKAARYGLNTGDINAVIQAALGGSTATTLLEADRQFNVVVRVAPEFRRTLDDVKSLKVGYQSGSSTVSIPLSEVADITLETGASYIYHERNQRYLPIKFSVRGRDLGGTIADAKARIAANVTVPTGYRIEWTGEFEELEQARARLLVIVPIALGLILILLYGLFNSLTDSLMALVGIPFSIAGGVLALLATGETFGISAAIGVVSLFGVSVMNGILIITYFNEVKATGIGSYDAMLHAASQRMRPMLMTALSACIGLLPAALSTGIGSQVQRPLATVVVGGMLIGPILMLVVVPALQILFLGGNDSGKPHVSEEEILRRLSAEH